jgi:hypothetical protein
MDTDNNIYKIRNSRRDMGSKRGQLMGMPFSIIFSIILIACFIFVAIIAIKFFWGFSEDSSQALLKTDFQNAVNDAWNSDRSDSYFNISLPSKITYVCFLDMNRSAMGKFSSYYTELEVFSNSGKYNFYLYPPRQASTDFRGMKIEHINVTKITSTDNPYCIGNKRSMKIVKSYYDSLVSVQ